MPTLKQLNETISARRKWMEETHYDWEMVDLIIEFFNIYYGFDKHPLTRKEAFLIGGYHEENGHLSLILDALFWKAVKPITPLQITSFYRITPFEFLSNFFKSYANSSKLICDYLDEQVKEYGNKILDYGGGSGWFSLWMAKRGYDVTFAEISEVSLEWMHWITKKKNLDIKIIDILKEDIKDTYDIVWCKDVIEHTPREHQADLFNYLKSRGNRFIISPVMCEGPEDREPMHFKLDSLAVEGEVVKL